MKDDKRAIKQILYFFSIHSKRMPIFKLFRYPSLDDLTIARACVFSVWTIQFSFRYFCSIENSLSATSPLPYDGFSTFHVIFPTAPVPPWKQTDYGTLYVFTVVIVSQHIIFTQFMPFSNRVHFLSGQRYFQPSSFSSVNFFSQHAI